jgi:DNA-binding transcriptional ArsR family regulator
MDSLVNAAARALANGDPLSALSSVALRDDPPALALRGIAMAQLGELERARELLRLAARSFGPTEAVARARCVVAEAEVALAARDLAGQPRGLNAALRTLASRGDTHNVWHGQLFIARRQLMLGHLAEAERILGAIDWQHAPARLGAVRELVIAEIALRRLETPRARAALDRARQAATLAQIPALSREIEHAARALIAPAARLLSQGSLRLVDLDAVERLKASPTLVVDACRRSVSQGTELVSLSRRPVLFQLACALARVWPQDASRPLLIETVFGVRRHNESHRARLRVEVGRLRVELEAFAEIGATPAGFALVARDGASVAVLSPPIEGEDAALLALLSDGASWSTSALALALGASQRTVQRALAELEAAGQVRAIGRGRAQRWIAPPLTGFTTTLLLPALPVQD